MSTLHEYKKEFKNNGLSGVLKRLFYVFPSRMTIRKVKNAKLEYGLNQKADRSPKVIVSLTSYPDRLDNIYLCLKSLLLQKSKPDRIIVWFGSDTKEEDLSSEVLSLKDYGIEFRYDDKLNLKPHKKYFYAIQEFPEDIVITVDDDSVYPSSTISSLLKSYSEHPDAVSARRVHLITFDKNEKIMPYSEWKHEYRRCRTESNQLLAVGVGGVLYPPGIFDERAFDITNIQEMCLAADDIWLKSMELLNGIKVVWVPCFFSHPPALSSKSSLGQTNVGAGKNDVYLSKMFEHYDITIDSKS